MTVVPDRHKTTITMTIVAKQNCKLKFLFVTVVLTGHYYFKTEIMTVRLKLVVQSAWRSQWCTNIRIWCTIWHIIWHANINMEQKQSYWNLLYIRKTWGITTDGTSEG
ncbi:hypothetical protein F8M41_018441 [Gigaspora margarita]|uniref:Uncharacterized protein n=1 Tax=Gigaspora margarita TaxID=4874 RepID=A0A8H4ELB7_GIGMA|nr:hypothetical protein F8M41_018441 [Gigaspora margarita]